MFCQNCGNRMDDNARFCSSCGAPMPQMTQPPPDMQDEGDGALPPGIERLEDGTLCWIYAQSLWSNPTILYTVLKVMMISTLIVMLLLVGLSIMEGDFDLGETLIIGGGLAAGVTVLSLIGYAVFAAVSGGKYNMLFFMNDTIIVHMAMPKEKTRGDRISSAAVIVGALVGNPTLTGVGLANYGRNTMESKFANVKSIVQDRSHDLIKVRDGFEFNQIYASPAQYDFVLSHIVSHCPNVRAE